MKQTESNSLTMVRNVLANLKKDQAFWSDEPEIVSEYNALEAEYNHVISILAVIAGLDPTGLTKSKNLSFDAITLSTYKLCRKMCIYARKTNNTALLQLVNHSMNSLTVGLEKEVISRCVAIVDKAAGMLDVLVRNKITPDELNHIRELLTVYNQQLDDRSTVKTDKTVSVNDIPEMINGMNSRLILLDDMIEGYIDDDDMIARYNAARIIVNTGKGKTAKAKTESDSTNAE